MQSVIQEIKKSLMAVVSSGGFKERDQGFGRSLADQVRTRDSLSPAQAYHALQMLHRGGYSQQIEKHGYKLPEIGALPAPVKKPVANGQHNSYQPQLQFDRNVVGSAKVENKRIVLGIEKGDIASLLKAKVPESVWKEKDKHWLIPLSSASHLLNLELKGIKLDPMIEKIVNKQKVLAEIGRATDCDFDVKLAMGSLLGYQKAGVKYLELSGGRALLGDDMGLGKSLQALAYLQEHPEIRPAIIVCPSSIKLNWGREIDKWMLDGKRKSYELISGRTTYPLSYADIYIINYDILGDWVDTLHSLDPKIVIGDEAHLVKNRDAGRTKAFRDLIDGIPHLILATGTPVMNRPVELWTLLNMVNPHAWGTFKEYASRYCNARLVSAGNGRKRLDVNGASNLEELHERSKPYIIRRLKEDVLTELPPKRRASVVIELSAKHKRLYQEAIGEVEKAINAPTGNAGKDYTNVLAKIEYAKQASAAGKLDCGAIQWIEDFLESGEKLIVFATHKFVVQAVMERFGKIAVSITGETRNEDRQKAVDVFQGDPKIRLFVGNIQAAGVGLTLTQASNVCFLELGAWTPGAFDQAEDRAWRLGQKNSVTCYYMVSENTIDMDIFELLEKKRMIIQKVVDNAEGELSFGVEQALISRIKSNAGSVKKSKS